MSIQPKPKQDDMSKAKMKSVTMNLPAGVARWLEAEAKRRMMTLDSLVEDLARQEREGVAVLDVDVIRAEDGQVMMQVFPDAGSGSGKDEAEALASLRESIARQRMELRNWRIERAWNRRVGKAGGGAYVEQRARVEFDRVKLGGLPFQLGAEWARASRQRKVRR